MSGFTAEDQSPCVVAYDRLGPWNRETATPKKANSMHTIIRNELETLASPEVAANIQILYGGSVNVKSRIFTFSAEIDGALVGGQASKQTISPNCCSRKKFKNFFHH
ncbi:MAG: hypothetical protein Ct9H300mP28_14060 [Pseudomonadota bacterium]|nr:MAG: hypothetical protein Ct9H300mP28_14060 [Pseudomonadota bacterium]